MSGKKYTDALKGFDRDQFYTPTEALGIVKNVAKAGFDESVDVSVRLGVDPRKADQMVRGTVALPSGTGKDVRVAVFAAGEAAAEAREAGADIVGADDLAAQVEAGKFDFDVAIATPDMMPLVGRLGRALGPRGLMPNPKTGTVTQDVGRAVSEFKGGKVEYRTDRYGNVHVPLGKTSFDPAALETNFRAVLDELQRAKPASAKGRYLRKITVSSTMGPGVHVDTGRLRPETSDPRPYQSPAVAARRVREPSEGDAEVRLRRVPAHADAADRRWLRRDRSGAGRHRAARHVPPAARPAGRWRRPSSRVAGAVRPDALGTRCRGRGAAGDRSRGARAGASRGPARGELGAGYDAARAPPPRNGRGLRLALSLGASPALLSVPWELLYRPPTFLANQRQTPVVRHLDVGRLPDPPAIDGAVRILGVIANPPDTAPLDVAGERDARRAGGRRHGRRAGAVVVDWLTPATPRRLREVLRDGTYHVLHYVGHGDFTPGGDGRAVPRGRRRCRAHRARQRRAGEPAGRPDALRLVVLNACDGARTSLTDPFAGVATTLVQLGVPAVIAMQFAISDAAAILFAEELYTNLIGRRAPVDAAVSEARKAIYVEQGTMEWATPVLFLADTEVELFDFVPDAGGAVAAAARPGAGRPPTGGAGRRGAVGRLTAARSALVGIAVLAARRGGRVRRNRGGGDARRRAGRRRSPAHRRHGAGRPRRAPPGGDRRWPRRCTFQGTIATVGGEAAPRVRRRRRPAALRGRPTRRATRGLSYEVHGPCGRAGVGFARWRLRGHRSVPGRGRRHLHRRRQLERRDRPVRPDRAPDPRRPHRRPASSDQPVGRRRSTSPARSDKLHATTCTPATCCTSTASARVAQRRRSTYQLVDRGRATRSSASTWTPARTGAGWRSPPTVRYDLRRAQRDGRRTGRTASSSPHPSRRWRCRRVWRSGRRHDRRRRRHRPLDVRGAGRRDGRDHAAARLRRRPRCTTCSPPGTDVDGDRLRPPDLRGAGPVRRDERRHAHDLVASNGAASTGPADRRLLAAARRPAAGVSRRRGHLPEVASEALEVGRRELDRRSGPCWTESVHCSIFPQGGRNTPPLCW